MQTLTKPLTELGLSNRIFTDAQLRRIIEGSKQRRYHLVNRAIKAGELQRRRKAAADAEPFLSSAEKQSLQLGRPASSALRVHNFLKQLPLMNIPTVAIVLDLSTPTVRKSVEHLEELGILIETTGKQRDTRYVYHQYLEIFGSSE
jgi:Fic family protein